MIEWLPVLASLVGPFLWWRTYLIRRELKRIEEVEAQIRDMTTLAEEGWEYVGGDSARELFWASVVAFAFPDEWLTVGLGQEPMNINHMTWNPNYHPNMPSHLIPSFPIYPPDHYVVGPESHKALGCVFWARVPEDPKEIPPIRFLWARCGENGPPVRSVIECVESALPPSSPQREAIEVMQGLLRDPARMSGLKAFVELQ